MTRWEDVVSFIGPAPLLWGTYIGLVIGGGLIGTAVGGWGGVVGVFAGQVVMLGILVVLFRRVRR